MPHSYNTRYQQSQRIRNTDKYITVDPTILSPTEYALELSSRWFKIIEAYCTWTNDHQTWYIPHSWNRRSIDKEMTRECYHKALEAAFIDANPQFNIDDFEAPWKVMGRTYTTAVMDQVYA